MEARPYQLRLAEQANRILLENNIVYLSMEVRTGKTITAFETIKLFGAKKVLFITKLKAIKGIEGDYNSINYWFELDVINYESLHKVDFTPYDLVVCDEAHKLGSYPKPNKVAKILNKELKHRALILLSGTPTPESFAQLYHQFWISKRSPFKQFVNFYGWHKVYGVPKVKYTAYGTCADYSVVKYDLIKLFTDKLMISFTQREAGFETNVSEHLLYCDIKPYTHDLIDRLKRNQVVEGKHEVILADTGVKLQSKIHQLYSGTIKFESGRTMVIDDSKAKFIKEKFAGKKIGIFYKFTAELEALENVFGDTLTTDLEEFNTTNKHIALQFVSGREGISLRCADCLVYYNIDFSALSYWQSRDRLTTLQRKTNDVYWVFSRGGIEEKIYNTVLQKKDYTLKHFKNDFGIRISKEGYIEV